MSIIHSKPFLEGVIDQVCVQPNAVDLRIGSIMEIGGQSSIPSDEPSVVRIAEDFKEFLPRSPPKTKNEYKDRTSYRTYWVLEPGRCYDVESTVTVSVPEGYAGTLQIRSTLARNGLLLVNGLYDSNYTGPVGGILHNNTTAQVLIEQSCRFAQFIMHQAETDHPYEGYYNVATNTLHLPTNGTYQ
jgi:deoxycytidine triphosphate deaminase